MHTQSPVKRVILGLAMSGCASWFLAGTSHAGVAAAADAPLPAAAPSPAPRPHVNLHGSSFAYGDVDMARHYLRRMYPEGGVSAAAVVADLKRAGATCDSKMSVSSCSFDDSFFRDDSLQRATWTVRIDGRPDGALAKINVTQTLRE